MIVIDRKFYSKYYNGELYANNLSDFSSNLTGSVMEEKKAVYTINVDVSFTLQQGLTLYTNAVNGTLRRQSGSWINDGWSVGDEFQASANGGANQNYTAKIIALTSNVLTYSKISGNDATENAQNWSMVLTSPLEGFKMKYGIIENSEPTNFFSKVDNITQSFYAQGVGIDTGGGVRSTGFVLAEANGLTINKSWVNGGVLVRYVQNIGHIQQFEVEHTFLIPYYVDGELTNLQTNTPPTDLNSNNSYKYVSEYEFRRVLTDPNSSKVVVDDSTLGSVGYFNEPFNGLNQPFDINSVTYEDASANVLNRIQEGVITTVKYRVTSSSSDFTSGQSLISYVSFLPDISEYQNHLNTLKENYLYDSGLGIADGVNNVVSSPNIIQEYKYTFVDSSNIDVELKVLFSDSRIDNTKSYLIGCEVASIGGANSLGNKTNLLVDVDTFQKSNDVLGLFDVTKMELETYPTPKGTNSFTSFKGWVEDSINLSYEFWLDISKFAFLDALNVEIVAFNTIDNSYFNLESVQVPLNSGVVVNGIQTYNFTVPRGFNFSGVNDYNVISLVNGSLLSGKQYYDGSISLKMDWQNWLSLPNADTVFYNNTQPNNGLNENASNYSLKNNYEIRFLVNALVTESNTNKQTNYIVSNIENEVYNYDEDNNITPIISGVIDTLDINNVSLGGSLLNNANTKIQSLWSSTSGFSSLSDYYVVISLEPLNSPSKNAIKLYDANLSFVGSDILAEYILNPNEILNGVEYKISSRIYCFESEETPIARMVNKSFTPNNGLFSFDLELLESDDTTPLTTGDEVIFEVRDGATTLERVKGFYGNPISGFTPVMGSPVPVSSIVNWVTGNATHNANIIFDKKSYAIANSFDYFNGSLSGSNWISNAKIIDFYINAIDSSTGATSVNSDNNLQLERAVDLIEGSCFTQIEDDGTFLRYSVYDNDGESENYNEQSTFEYRKNGTLISSVLPTFTPANFDWGTRDLNTETITGFSNSRFLTKIGFNNGMIAQSETVINGTDEQLGFTYNRLVSSSETYNRINLNSITTADSENISFPVLAFNNTRTLNFKFTPTINIISSTPFTTIMAYYDNNNTSIQTNRIDISFVNGKLNFQRRISGNSFTIVSDSDNWVSGQEYDISFVIDSSTGMSMIVDGVVQTDTDPSTGTINPSTGNLFIGGNVPAGIRYTPFKISNVQFWSTARTLTQNNTDKDTYYLAGESGLIESYHFANETGANATGVNGNTAVISTNNAGGTTHINNVMRELFTINSGNSLIMDTFPVVSEVNIPSTIVKRAVQTVNDYNGTNPSDTVEVLKNGVVLYPSLSYTNNSSSSTSEINWFDIDLNTVGIRNSIKYDSQENGVEFKSEYQLELNYIY